MTREEATNNVFMGINLTHITHAAIGFADAMWLLRSDVITFVNKIFDEHEKELKDKDEKLDFEKVQNTIIQDAQMKKIINYKEQLKAKDEEIQYMNMVCVDFKNAFSIHRKKARSIVAMLFWKWKKAKRISLELGQDSAVKAIVYDRENHFNKAYKMLKNNND